jgi:2-polyprenyl-3-methyl-5-hydroxy-6-metoxy-1,4-benzoquinol methylase
MDKNEYSGYFRTHVKIDFGIESIWKDSQFVYSQLNLVNKYISLDSIKTYPTLEIGSGMGRLALLLDERGFLNYNGIDLDDEAVEFCKKNLKLKNYIFFNDSINGFANSQSGIFKNIFCFETLEHLRDPWEGVKVISKMLQKDGLFIGSAPYPFKRNILGDETHLNVLHPLNWKRVFEKNGFQVLIIRPMTFLPYLWRIHRELNVILPFYVPLFNLVSTSLIIAKKI